MNDMPFPPVVTTGWLATRLGQAGVLVVDTSIGLAQDRPGHVSMREAHTAEDIPGAVYADIVGELSEPGSPFELTRPSPERAADVFGRLGVGPTTTVIAYDTINGACAARLWWLLKSFGHDAVAILNGGLRQWKATGHAVEAGLVRSTPATFLPRERPALWADKARVQQVVRDYGPQTLINAISHPAGAVDQLPPDMARLLTSMIPGSLSLPYPKLLDPQNATLRSTGQLRQELADVSTGTGAIVYCGSGLGASLVALALVATGRSDIAVYDGSLDEWLADPEAPVEVYHPF